MASAADRHGAQHAVEDQQEAADDQQADDARRHALAQRLLTERRGDLRLGDQLQPDRQRARLELAREVLRRGEREAPRDLGAVGRVDPFRVLRVVDEGDRDQLVVEHDREVLEGRLLRDSRQPRVFAAPRDFLRHAFEHAASGGREAEGHVGGAAAAFLGALLGVRDVLAREHGVVVEHVPAVRRRHLAGRRFFGHRLHDDGPGAHVDDLQLRARRDRLARAVEARLARFRPAHHRLVGFVEQVPRAVDAAGVCPARRCVLLRRAALRIGGEVRVLRRQDHWALGRAQDRLVLGQPGRRMPRVRAARDGRVGRRGFAGRPDDVRLPVVEVELRGLPDLFFGLLDVLDVRQADRDFLRARALDFGLRDAELVDALAHDFDRLFERLGVDLRLRRRLRFVDELHAALEVQAEARLLRHDDEQRDDDEPRHDGENEGVATTVLHLSLPGRA